MSYKLSTELTGHTNDVRVVSSYKLGGNEAIITASRDGTARVWQQTETLEYSVVKTLTGHTGPVTAITILPADELAGRNKSFIVTGGQDAKVLVHDLDADEPVDVLQGHEKYVSSITYFAGLLISVSWDCTLRVWDDLRRHTKCHSPAAYIVYGVPGPEPSFVLTGGADKLIKLWQLSSLSCVQEYRGHEDVVRDLKVFSSEQFVSIANDCTVRLWSIHTAACLQVYGMHEAYVYSISVFPASGGSQFLSCGEDRTVRVWKNGSCDQTILLPAQSVWSVHYLENGDFVVGSSDYKARVFSSDQTRQASAEKLATFQQEVEEQQKAAGYDAIDVSKLPGEEVLASPGKPGETKLVRVKGKAEVYQWNNAESRWDKIGDALGQAPPSQTQRPVYQGKEYDYVFDIQIECDDHMKTLKLPYNQTDDPWVTAHKFLDDNMLPQGYLDQVAHFIIKNAGGTVAPTQPVVAGSDPLTGPSRYIPDSSGPPPPPATTSYQPPPPQQNTSAGNPYFPMDSYKTFVSPDDYHEKVVQKLREFNETIDQIYQLSGAEMSCLSGLCKDILLPHWDAMSPSHQAIINKLLSWPAEYCFPGLDVVRLVVLKSTGSRCLVSDELAAQQFLHTMENFLCGPGAQSKNQMAVLRMFANLFVTKLGEELMMKNFDWINAKMEPIYSSDNRTCQIALGTVLLNYCHCYSKNASETVHTSLAINTNRVIQSSSFDKEAKCRVLIGIGILVQSSPTARQVLCAPDVVTTIKSLTSTSGHVKLVECARSVVKEMERLTT
ncbi:phospholipase A-2-activating protein-like [Dysidea avara]|uniref:phospholipase A-2-activating protein-like n=1 Tax=Dysidea avara TaxID=196820 RepID=UPI00331FD4E4